MDTLRTELINLYTLINRYSDLDLTYFITNMHHDNFIIKLIKHWPPYALTVYHDMIDVYSLDETSINSHDKNVILMSIYHILALR